MNSKFVKTWFIIAGSFAGLGVIYYIIRLFDIIFNPNKIEGTLLAKLNIYAIIALGVALLMLIVFIPLSKRLENKASKKVTVKASDEEILAKYKSKKTK
jgi:hypothetical protein